LQNPEISGVEYQHGELFGYEVREYLLEKCGHECQYCHGRSGDPVLEIDHIVPKSRGGTDRVSNLTIACRTCNREKGNRTAEEYGHPEVQARAQKPLKDAAAVNATRWAVYLRLAAFGIPVEVGTGGRTKYNRARLGLPKSRWLDAACVGESTPPDLYVEPGPVLGIRAVGHGRRQRCGTDKRGFPVRHTRRAKKHLGFQTGDLVRAVVPKGKHAGVHVGRIVIRHRPWFRLNNFDVHPKYLRLLQRADGYEYVDKEGAAPLSKPRGGLSCNLWTP
ncbi:MAG: HNH endonuclease, partial [Firmicutes bacterium]|nr:HNH endonuclease [Bacillota bacterium]